jgi:glycine/D-amino acid oxidase-like deaminating enzyme
MLPGTNISIRPRVPWWETVDAKIVSQLELERLGECDSFDVAVIGAGISGLSAAQAAASQGARVIVLEKAPLIGLGASGQNAGIVCVGANMPLSAVKPGSQAGELWAATAALAEEVFAEAAREGALLRARRTGSLFLAKSPTAARRMAVEVKLRRNANLRAELMGPQEAKNLSHGLLNVEGVHAAQFLPDEGRAHPLSLLATLARRARDAGAKLFGGAEVVKRDEVAAKNGRSTWCLTLTGGQQVHARAIIRCTGPVVEANARIFALAFKNELPDELPVFQDAAPFTYYDYRPGDGFISVSGGKYGRAGGGASDERYWHNMAKAAREWLPQLASHQPDYCWAVDLNVTADMIPEIKRLSTSAPAVAIEGLGALGVLPGMALGRRAGAEMVSSLADSAHRSKK